VYVYVLSIDEFHYAD